MYLKSLSGPYPVVGRRELLVVVAGIYYRVMNKTTMVPVVLEFTVKWEQQIVNHYTS